MIFGDDEEVILLAAAGDDATPPSPTTASSPLPMPINLLQCAFEDLLFLLAMAITLTIACLIGPNGQSAKHRAENRFQPAPATWPQRYGESY
ncbi:MAG: hypothetical protein WC763_05735 [Candidatus Paceibacterota bacterium]